MPFNMNIARALIIAAIVFVPGLTSAQVTIVENEEGDQPTVYKMTVSPAPEPKPALKYRFLVPAVEQTHGNAALFYYKAMSFEGPDQIFEAGKLYADDEKFHLFFEAPLGEFPKEEVDKVTGWLGENSGYGLGYRLWLQQAAKCDYCNWEEELREEGIYTLLPQAQKTRSLALDLALRTRLQIVQGNYEAAISTLRLGYALSRNLGKGMTLVHNLIGIAIQGILDNQTRTLIAQPDSPNLYWAITDLASHSFDERDSLSFESRLWDFTIHELPEMDRRVLSPDEALRVATKLSETIWPIAGIKQQHADPAVILGIALYSYPRAEHFLLEHGYSAERIAEMPVVQTVLLAWWKQFEVVRDDAFKWLMLPDDEAQHYLARSDKDIRAAESQGLGGYFTRALPAIQAATSARFRSLRHTDMLRTVEALRMYAAEHGNWPEKLEDINEVSVPLDPWTHKPFEYSVQNGVAVLESPRLPKAPWPNTVNQRYELTLRSKTESAGSRKEEK